MKVTIDASVWLSALMPTETSHASCAAFMALVMQQPIEMHQPVLFIVELSATIARHTRDEELAMRAGQAALEVPGLVLHELSHELAATSAHVAAVCALRGADAMYVATARTADATLITLDREALKRGVSMASIQTPSQWMSSQHA